MSSLNNIAWKKFKKDPLGYFGLLIILFSIFISLFVYFLVPDKSSYANQMQLELSTKPPGFNVYKPPASRKDSKESFLICKNLR